MEIRNPLQALGEADASRRAHPHSDITRPNRKGIQRAVESGRAAREEAAEESKRRDRLELSSAGSRLQEAEDAHERARAERLAELREAHEDGRLATRERAERAAGRILGDER